MSNRVLAPAALIALLALSLCVLTSYLTDLSAATILGGRNATPEAAARGAVCAPDGRPEEFRVVGTHERDSGVMVLYEARCRSSSGAARREGFGGWAAVERVLFSWEVMHDNSGRHAPLARPGDPMAYETSCSAGGECHIVQGRVLSPARVKAVEVVFDNGRVYSDDTEDGGFVFFEPGDVRPCEVRALGPDGRVVMRSDPLPTERSPASRKACLELRQSRR